MSDAKKTADTTIFLVDAYNPKSKKHKPILDVTRDKSTVAYDADLKNITEDIKAKYEVNRDKQIYGVIKRYYIDDNGKEHLEIVDG